MVDDPLWGRRVVYQRVDIDEDALRAIAKETRGAYFHAEGLKGLAEVYDTIDRMEKTKVRVQTFDRYRELYPAALFPALALLALAALATNTRYLEMP